MTHEEISSQRQGIRAVAEHAGVSIASVSRAVNLPSTVSSTLRARIADAINVVGYIPHAPARALSLRRTRAVGAIVPTIRQHNVRARYRGVTKVPFERWLHAAIGDAWI